MNKLISTCMLAGLAVAFAACSSKDHVEPLSPNSKDPVEITLSCQLNELSRAQTTLNTAFKANATAGFFVSTKDTPPATYENIKHQSDGGGVFRATNSRIFWPISGANIDVYGYSPYADHVSLTSSNVFAVATDQSNDNNYIASDLLIATPSADVANTAYSSSPTTKVTMAMNHMLSKVTINFKTESSSVDVSGATATIKAATACTYKVQDQSVDAASAPTVQEITVAKDVSVNSSTTASHSAIIVPQTIAAGTTFITLATSSAEYKFQLAAAQTFESGKEYTFNIALTPEKAEATIQASIAAWGSTTAINGEAPYSKNIQVGQYMLANGTFTSSESSVPAQAVGMVILTDDPIIPDGYSAMVISVLPLESPAVFGSDTYTSSYISTTSDFKNAVSGMDLITTIKSKENLTAFRSFYLSQNYNTIPPDNSTDWIIPSVNEMKKIVEFMKTDGESWTLDGTTRMVYGAPKIPAVYTPVLNLSNDNTYFMQDTEDDLYWTSTEGSSTQVWTACMSKSSYTMSIELKTKASTQARVIPIRYVR